MTPGDQSYTLPRKFTTKLQILATKAIHCHVNLRQNHELSYLIMTPGDQSYTLPRKFTTKLQFLATKAIHCHVNLRQNHEFKLFDNDSWRPKLYIAT